ncbi:lysine--tRNA ligase [Candidatus Parvarchaeota archaeon]|nr:lysine--tRNA ligase [Candidatus Parvarchaeota archaeon]
MAFEFEFDKDRLRKMEILRASGIEPYGGKFNVTSHAAEIKVNFERLNGKNVSVAGRIMGKRSHGKLSFLDLRDESGDIQIYVQEKDLDAVSLTILKNLDSGDIIGVEGEVIKTKTNEISVNSRHITILAKSLLPLPPKWYGLEDVEKRYRKRYLDFIINPESREKIVKTSKILSEIRKTLENKGFLEVVVPILQQIPGGANAKPFITHYNALDRDLYLKIASELYLKRLMIGGFEKIFDISKNFRNEGVDTKHNPEFIMLELYQAYGDLGSMMVITEEIIKAAVRGANGSYKAKFDGKEIDFSGFQIKTMEDAVKETVNLRDKKEIISEGKKIDNKVESYGEAINAIFEEKVSKTIVQPTFITKFPVEVSPLAKRIPEEDGFVYRFELYTCGMEIANAFSELNDPVDQVKRFDLEAKRKEKGIDETQEFDRDFIEAMGYGMPPAGGVGIGLDRLSMIITDSKSIKEVIAFPQLRTLEN